MYYHMDIHSAHRDNFLPSKCYLRWQFIFLKSSWISHILIFYDSMQPLQSNPSIHLNQKTHTVYLATVPAIVRVKWCLIWIMTQEVFRCFSTWNWFSCYQLILNLGGMSEIKSKMMILSLSKDIFHTDTYKLLMST